MSIKNTKIGIHIKWGANNGSSDADIFNVNIVGNNSKTSVGVLLEGHDNTLTNMRIASVHAGIQADSCGDIFHNLHPLYIAVEIAQYLYQLIHYVVFQSRQC